MTGSHVLILCAQVCFNTEMIQQQVCITIYCTFATKCKKPLITLTSGAGPRSMERREVSGVNGNERHLCHSLVSSPMEELRKDKRRSDDSGRGERTKPGLFVFCVRLSSVRGCRFTFVFVYFIIKIFKCCRFPPLSSHIYELLQ